MPTTTQTQPESSPERSHRAGYPLQRSNAVWDLTSIPPETQLRVDIILEFPSSGSESPVKISHSISSLERVSWIIKFVSGLIPNPNDKLEYPDIMAAESRPDIQLYRGDVLMDRSDYLYEYGLVDGDIVRVVSVAKKEE